MGKLEGVAAAELRAALADASDHKAVRRLMVALAYEDGEPVDRLSDRYGIPRSTLYYWLDRFEERGVDGALTDEPRPGRPPKLDEDDRDRLDADLELPPNEFGYEAADWTPDLVRRHLEGEYGVDYSTGHVRRLLRGEP